jgi:serine/threonine protein phosphatase PrpC
MAVLDGVGGHGRGGEVSAWVASQFALMPAFSDRESMWLALDELHHFTRQRFSAMQVGVHAPGTTLLVLEIPVSGPAWIYHVGNSRMWLERGGGLELLTVDHCPSTAHALRGELSFSAWQYEVLYKYHRPICQAFGLGSSLLEVDCLCPDLTPLESSILPLPLSEMGDRRSISIPHGSVVLLATDGLWCFQQPMKFLMLVDEMLSEQTTCMEDLADRVLAAHQDASIGNVRCDNTTMIICRLQ